MLWLIVSLVAVVVVAVLFACWVTSAPLTSPPPNFATVELHAIRKKLEVAEFKAEVRQDTARLRRELRDELDKLEGGGKSS